MTRYICMIILMIFLILSCSTVKTEKVEMNDRIEKISHSQETDTITKAIFLFYNYENSILPFVVFTIGEYPQKANSLGYCEVSLPHGGKYDFYINTTSLGPGKFDKANGEFHNVLDITDKQSNYFIVHFHYY
jgi:hypothetical protein